MVWLYLLIYFPDTVEGNLLNVCTLSHRSIDMHHFCLPINKKNLCLILFSAHIIWCLKKKKGKTTQLGYDNHQFLLSPLILPLILHAVHHHLLVVLLTNHVTKAKECIQRFLRLFTLKVNGPVYNQRIAFPTAFLTAIPFSLCILNHSNHASLFIHWWLFSVFYLCKTVFLR